MRFHQLKDAGLQAMEYWHLQALGQAKRTLEGSPGLRAWVADEEQLLLGAALATGCCGMLACILLHRRVR